jgi:hypothetical protein
MALFIKNKKVYSIEEKLEYYEQKLNEAYSDPQRYEVMLKKYNAIFDTPTPTIQTTDGHHYDLQNIVDVVNGEE